MPISKNPPGKRDYKHEYAEYQGTPTQIKHRAERNEARRAETKKLGHAPQGDVPTLNRWQAAVQTLCGMRRSRALPRTVAGAKAREATKSRSINNSGE